MGHNLKQDILNAVRNGYQPINDPSKQSVDWSKVSTTGSNVVKPYHIPPASVKSDDDTFIISFRDYNDMLTKIYYLEEQVKFLQIVNSKLANIKPCRCRRKRG